MILLYIAPADWLGILSLAGSILAGLGYLIFKTGVLVNKVENLELSMGRLELRMDKLEEKMDKLEKRMDKLEERMDKLEERLDVLEWRVEGIDRRLVAVEVVVRELWLKVGELWIREFGENHSPIMLNTEGRKVLESSGVEKLTNTRYPEILERVRARSPQNGYQVQAAVVSVMSEYKGNPAYIPQLEDASFQSGYGIDAILYVAAINIRDKVLTDLGFDLQGHSEK